MCNHTPFPNLSEEAHVDGMYTWYILSLTMSHTSFPFLVNNNLVIELICNKDKYIMNCFPLVAI